MRFPRAARPWFGPGKLGLPKGPGDWSFEFAWLRFANRRGLIEPSASVGGC
jgi:hypothetical protein